jgi:hypothetical protein
MKTVTLECGCEVEWQDWGGAGEEDFPWIGHYAWCEKHGDTEVAYLDPADYNVIEAYSYVIHGDGGHQTDAGASGMAYAVGTRLHVWKRPDTDGTTGWWYCFSGVSEDGNAYESDDVGPFENLAEALEAATYAIEEHGGCDLVAWPNDRSGWLAVGVKNADLFTDDDMGRRELTPLGETAQKCLDQVGEVAATLFQFMYSKWQSNHPAYTVYAAPFERDLDFVAEEYASFGWGVCFVPDIHIAELNDLLKEYDISNVKFYWERSNIL